MKCDIRGVLVEGTPEEIAELLRIEFGKNVSTIETRVKRAYRRRKHKHNAWTEQENSIIKTFYNFVGAKNLVAKLPGRSKASICKQAHVLGVRKNKIRKVRI